MRVLWYTVIGLIGIVMILGLFRNASSITRQRFLVAFTLVGVVVYGLYWAIVILVPSDLLILLPLQLCDLAVFLMPIGLGTKRQGLMDFLFYACGLGAMAALLLMIMAAEDSFYALDLNFFFSHFAILALPYLMIVWGLYDPQPTVKKAFVLTGILLILTGFMHGLNLFLYQTYHADAFYFFTVVRTGVLVSPLLAWFASIIPYDYWYMTLTLPILYLYMVLVWIGRRVILQHQHKKTASL